MRRLLTVFSVLSALFISTLIGTSVGYAQSYSSNSSSSNSSGGLSGTSNSGSSGNFPYCNGDFVIPGGVGSTSDVTAAYSYPRVKHVYQHFGITQQDMDNIGNSMSNGTGTANGTVTKSGNVIISGTVVATNAITAGCQNIAGSTTVNDGYMTFYTRPTSVSFASSSLNAYIVMKNGQFDYAILTSCGNPVKATPITPRTVTPVTKTVVRPTPAAPTSAQATANATATVNVTPQVLPATTNTTQPATQTVYTTPVATKALPNTGADGAIAIFGLTSLLGGLGHLFYTRRFNQ
jgi:hypothetical protein